MNKQNKYNYQMHAIMMKRLYEKSSPMKCLNWLKASKWA